MQSIDMTTKKEQPLKVKPLHIMLPNTRAYVKVQMDKLNKFIFWLKMVTYWKNIIVFGTDSALILKKIDSEPVYNKKFWKPK